MCSKYGRFESDSAQAWGTSESVCQGTFELLMASYAPLVSSRTDYTMHDLVCHSVDNIDNGFEGLGSGGDGAGLPRAHNRRA